MGRRETERHTERIIHRETERGETDRHTEREKTCENEIHPKKTEGVEVQVTEP